MKQATSPIVTDTASISVPKPSPVIAIVWPPKSDLHVDERKYT